MSGWGEATEAVLQLDTRSSAWPVPWTADRLSGGVRAATAGGLA